MLAVYNSASICAFDEPLKCGLRLDPGTCVVGEYRFPVDFCRVKRSGGVDCGFRSEHHHVPEQGLERAATHVDRVETENGTKDQRHVRTASGRQQPSGPAEQCVIDSRKRDITV